MATAVLVPSSVPPLERHLLVIFVAPLLLVVSEGQGLFEEH